MFQYDMAWANGQAPPPPPNLCYNEGSTGSRDGEVRLLRCEEEEEEAGRVVRGRLGIGSVARFGKVQMEPRGFHHSDC
ncbi:hypothetical protein PBY51_002380 [Eleginops maclovinus]|uniref:Uncharacterized protein n=1 Tax=Eleginops maclovinus TaxID=56733 RepID=A0AAN8AFQ8_ELEMC|nr:hypothetical protein PBY51_002380 [Eleginops maclovinus]